MANRNLSIVIDVDNLDAKQKLRETDQAIAGVGKTGKSVNEILGVYDKTVQDVVKSKQAATTATDAFNETLNATREAVETSTSRWTEYMTAAKEAWNALKAIRFSDIRAGLNDVAEGAGLTVANLGLLNTAGLLLGAAYGGWAIGRMIADFFTLDDAIGRATARLIGFGDVGGETAAAKQDTINKAIQLGADKNIIYAAAVEFVTKKIAEQRLEIERHAAGSSFERELQGWRNEINDLDRSGVLDSLIANLKSHNFTVKELAERYHVSAEAINLVSRELHLEDEARKAAMKTAQDHAREMKKAAEEEAKAAQQLLEAHLKNIEASRAEEAEAQKAINKQVAGMRTLMNLAVAMGNVQIGGGKFISNATPMGLMPDLSGQAAQHMAEFTSGGGFLGGLFDKFKSTFDPKTIVSSMFGSALGGLLSTGIGFLTKGIGSLFGAIFHTEEKEVNKTRQAFVDAAGGLAALNQKAHDAGLTLDHLLQARNVQQYTAAVNELKAAFDFQDQAVQTLQETLSRYNFTAEEKGPAVAFKEQDALAQQLYQDWKVLTAAQIDAKAITREMAAGVNDFIHTALKIGYEVPAAMKPMIQQMIDMGVLTDLAGNKIGSLEDSGITFAETMSAGFDRVVKSVDELTAAIGRFLGLTNQAANAVKNFPDIPHQGGGGDERDRFHRGGVVLPFPRAHMGLAVDERMIIAQTGEGILNRAAMRRIGGARGLNRLNREGGAGSAVNVTVNVDGYIDSPQAQRNLARIVDAQVMQSLRLRARAS